MFNNVNKSIVLQREFRNVKIIKYDLNNKMLLTVYT